MSWEEPSQGTGVWRSREMDGWQSLSSYVVFVGATSPAVTVNGNVDDAVVPVVSNSVDGDDDRWEQVRSRNRTVFNSTVSIPILDNVLSL